MLSAVVVNHNAGPALTSNLQRLWDSAGALLKQIIVVDNASDDDSMAGVERLIADGLPILALGNTRNEGFARACNQGAGASNQPYLLFINPDVTVETDTIQRVLVALEETEEAACAGCLLVNPDGTEQRGCRRQLPDARLGFLRAAGLSRLFPRRFEDFNLTAHALPDRPQPVPAISGAFMLVKREALAAIGGWDETYFLHMEDLDLCHRLQEAGRVTLFVPTARAVHAQGLCSRRRPLWVEWHKHRSMWRYYRKFESAGWGAVWAPLVGFGIAGHFLAQSVAFWVRGRRPSPPSTPPQAAGGSAASRAGR